MQPTAFDGYLHPDMINRGIPFHNMALMCPATTEADADAHTTVFAAAADELLGLAVRASPRLAASGPQQSQSWEGCWGFGRWNCWNGRPSCGR